LIRGRRREECFRAFLSNNVVGAAIFGGIAIEFLLRSTLFPPRAVLPGG
jgi:4-hydroxybenzoate polyprenyltransferase